MVTGYSVSDTSLILLYEDFARENLLIIRVIIVAPCWRANTLLFAVIFTT